MSRESPAAMNWFDQRNLHWRERESELCTCSQLYLPMYCPSFDHSLTEVSLDPVMRASGDSSSTILVWRAVIIRVTIISE